MKVTSHERIRRSKSSPLGEHKPRTLKCLDSLLRIVRCARRLAEACQPELSVLVPAHNEESRIGQCLHRLSLFLSNNHPSSEILVSEDGSSDGTLEIVREFEKQNRERIPIRLLDGPRRLGKGAGLKRGIQAARGTYTVFIDADLPVQLDSITSAVQLLKSGADVVAGSRCLKGSSRDDPFRRRALSHGYRFLAKLLLGLPWDSQCGFKAFRTDVGCKAFALTGNSGFAFDVEFLLQARRVGANIVELPVIWSHHDGSSLSLSRDIIGMGYELLDIFLREMTIRSERLWGEWDQGNGLAGPELLDVRLSRSSSFRPEVTTARIQPFSAEEVFAA